MTESGKIPTSIDTQRVTDEWNEIFVEGDKQRKAKIERAIPQFQKMGDTPSAEFLTRFLEKSAALHHSQVIVKALLGENPTDGKNAWKSLTDDASGKPVGIGRGIAPKYYDALHVDITRKWETLYDAVLILAQHSTIVVKDTEGNEETWRIAGTSIAAFNRERGILVTLKPTGAANVLADTLAFSVSNFENKSSSTNPEGLKVLQKKTLETVQVLTGKEEPTVEDLLRALKIVGSTSSGDENKETMYVLQALVEIPDDRADSVAETLNGYWVSPAAIQRTAHLDASTNHLEKAANIVRSVLTIPGWINAFAQYSIVNNSDQQE